MGTDVPADTGSLIALGSAKDTLVNAPDTTAKPATKNLPLPQNLTLSNNTFSSDLNSLLQISGENLDGVQSVQIGDQTIVPVFYSGSLFVHLQRDTFSAGEYKILLALADKNTVFVPETVNFTSTKDASIAIANITPVTLSFGKDSYLVLQGYGFSKIVSLELNNNIILKSPRFQVINDRVLAVQIPSDTPVGTYFFNIMDTSSVHSLPSQTFRIVP